ncbi:glucosamine inositolphosphorylceramide transferase family protein [Mongoliitalea lutea]|uniref:Methionyl-tRNA formyltransferase n=1 Tax=Mongoliitalea lutea TaxID=849756 RepID=A0A8J3CVI5_9BACT|nr:formyltransferase family protein [Mongoliitalea lutea]GHB23759.1 hypothetical protein GCM10008106_00430 [Mongoliitalea lutea]
MAMYRIGIMVDQLHLQAWQLNCVQELQLSGLARIEVIILNQHPLSSKKSSNFLYKLYRKVDRFLFKPAQDAFKKQFIYSLLEKTTPVIPVQPIQSKYRDAFSSENLNEIASFHLDIILRFGFRILSGPILALPRLGIWSFHHGNPRYYRGGPPAFWEVMEKQASTGVVLMRLSEALDQGEILYESLTQTDPLSVERNAQKLFWVSSFFPVRVLKRFALDPLVVPASSPIAPPAPLKRNPSNWQMLALLTKHLWNTIDRKFDEWKLPAHWEVGSANVEIIQISGNTVIPPKSFLKNPFPNTYLADPFPVKEGKTTWIFAECYDKKSAKGSIVVLDGNGLGHRVLEESWHVSYPFIFSVNDTFFMVPESSQVGKLYLYEAIKFPFHWERKSILLAIEGYDPTIYKNEKGFWLFVNQKSHELSSPFDELHLYFSPTLTQAHWEPSPLNPIVSDVRKARPAGNIFNWGDQLIRPAQDSELRYGHRIRLMEITNLSLTHYQEQEIGRVEADAPALGIHTLNFQEETAWVDFYFRK